MFLCFFFSFFVLSFCVCDNIYIFERYKSRCCALVNASICFQAYGYGTMYIISTFCFQFFLRVAKKKKPSTNQKRNWFNIVIHRHSITAVKEYLCTESIILLLDILFGPSPINFLKQPTSYILHPTS